MAFTIAAYNSIVSLLQAVSGGLILYAAGQEDEMSKNELLKTSELGSVISSAAIGFFGGSFFPNIEMNFVLRNFSPIIKALRLLLLP